MKISISEEEEIVLYLEENYFIAQKSAVYAYIPEIKPLHILQKRKPLHNYISECAKI